MKIPAMLYFWIWAVVGISFLRFGLRGFDKTDLSESVPPVVMSLFKHYLFLLLCLSFIYALVFRPLYRHTRRFGVLLLLVNILFYSTAMSNKPIADWRFIVYYMILLFAPLFYYRAFKHFPYIDIRSELSSGHMYGGSSRVSLVFKFAVEPAFSLIFAAASTILYPPSELFVLWDWLLALTASVTLMAIPRDKCVVTTAVESLIQPVLENKKTEVKFVEFTIGLLGTLLFQYFFKFTSWYHVMAFLCITVAWLAILALQRALSDFGVFNFLLGNVLVGCTVNIYGLGIATWIAYFVALGLYGVRLLVKTASVVDIEGAPFIQLQMRKFNPNHMDCSHEIQINNTSLKDQAGFSNFAEAEEANQCCGICRSCKYQIFAKNLATLWCHFFPT